MTTQQTIHCEAATARSRMTLIVLVFLVMTATACASHQPPTPAPSLKGKVVVTDKAGIRIHTYVSPEESTLVTSQIIESRHGLVVVDAQFLVPYARELRRYADSLGKPIQRVMVSHAHPDHWFGLAEFSDVPIYSLADTRQVITEKGRERLDALRQSMGELVPTAVVAPGHVLAPGAETIDGVRYEYERFTDAEGDVHLLIKLPDAQTVIVQDLAFNNVHLFLGNNTPQHWIIILESLQTLKGYNTVLVGHGEPTDKSVYGDNIGYLKDAISVLDKARTTQELKSKMLERYPGRRAAALLDISGLYLYEGQ